MIFALVEVRGGEGGRGEGEDAEARGKRNEDAETREKRNEEAETRGKRNENHGEDVRRAWTGGGGRGGGGGNNGLFTRGTEANTCTSSFVGAPGEEL